MKMMNNTHVLFWLGAVGAVSILSILALFMVALRDNKKLRQLRDRVQRESVVKRLTREDSGQDLTEYALILCLVALVTIASTQLVGSTLAQVFGSAASAFGSH
jgi:Flp pilus assembly pilin Flp